MTCYQIGTDEPDGVVGSRAARAEDLRGALDECREYSRAEHVREAWLREYTVGSDLGPVIARFVRGRRTDVAPADGNPLIRMTVRDREGHIEEILEQELTARGQLRAMAREFLLGRVADGFTVTVERRD